MTADRTTLQTDALCPDELSIIYSFIPLHEKFTATKADYVTAFNSIIARNDIPRAMSIAAGKGLFNTLLLDHLRGCGDGHSRLFTIVDKSSSYITTKHYGEDPVVFMGLMKLYIPQYILYIPEGITLDDATWLIENATKGITDIYAMKVIIDTITPTITPTDGEVNVPGRWPEHVTRHLITTLPEYRRYNINIERPNFILGMYISISSDASMTYLQSGVSFDHYEIFDEEMMGDTVALTDKDLDRIHASILTLRGLRRFAETIVVVNDMKRKKAKNAFTQAKKDKNYHKEKGWSCDCSYCLQAKRGLSKKKTARQNVGW